VDAPLTRTDGLAAARAGTAARANQARSLGRALPAERDPALMSRRVSTSLLRRAVAVVDRDRDLVGFVATRIRAAQRGEGRPVELPVRSALVCFVLLGICGSNFHVLNLPELMASLSWRARRQIGVDYKDRRGGPKQVSYQQLLRAFHAMARAFDPLDPAISWLEAKARAEDLQQFSFRLIQASITDRFRPGDLAVDATLKWGWDRPGGLHAKLQRHGRDGDAGSPPSLTEIIDDSGVAFVRDPLAELRAKSPTHSRGPSTWGPGSAWVGRPNARKSVYGIALHAVTATAATAPPVIEAIAVTPAPGLPATAAFGLLQEIQMSREHRGCHRPLGRVVADPAYSANPNDWQLPIRALGGSPIFRLHRTNQAGRRLHQGVTFVDGRPYCPCVPDELAELPFPRFPARKAQYDAFATEVTKRRRFEMKPNTGYRDDGSRQFKAPHWDSERKDGGCVHCVQADGSPVIDKDTGLPRLRCCTHATKVFSRDELALYQDDAFGEPEWFTHWNARDRVEGTFGIFKNLAVVNWGHDYHHFVGLARETLVATFAVIAHNFHVQRTWRARMALTALRPRPIRAKKVADDQRLEPRATNGATPKRRGPEDLEFLGSPRAGP